MPSVDVGCTTYRLVGDVLIWTAFVCYAGPFSLNDRATLLDNWTTQVKRQNIPCTENSDIAEAMTDANTVRTILRSPLPKKTFLHLPDC